MRRHANKKDACHAEIVAALHKQGAVFIDIDLSTGIDGLVGYKGFWMTLEIKAGKGKLTDRQLKWGLSCDKHGLPHYVIREGESVSNLLDQFIQQVSHAQRLARGLAAAPQS